MKKETLYEVVWIINGTVKETLDNNMPLPLARWSAKKYSRTTHKSGKVIARPQN